MGTKITLGIEGMSCGGCVSSVRRVLSATPGVTVCDVRVGTATVELDPAHATELTLREAIDKAGFTVLAVTPS